MLSVINERLECPKALLIGLARTVETIIDVSVYKQSIFYLSSNKNHLQARVKAILKHGTKIKHHIIYNQPTFAAFDSWLEQCLTDFSLLSILQSRRHELEDHYYDWALIRNPSLFQAFIDIVQVLSTRDVVPLLNIMTMMEANLQLSSIPQSQIQTMPLCGDPLLASLLAMEDSTEDRRVAAAATVVNIPVAAGKHLSRSVDEINANHCKLEFTTPPRPSQTVIERNDASPEVNIPNFSYSYQSPVSSPPIDRLHPESLSNTELRVPELRHASSSNDLPRRRPSCSSETKSLTGYSAVLTAGLLSSQMSSSEEGRFAKNKAGWTESFLESGGLVLPPAMGHFPRPQKGQTLTSFLKASLSDNLPDLDRENAHFNVSEALISAFERIKIQKYQDKLKAEQCSNGDSNEEDSFGTVHKSTAQPMDLPGPSKSPKRHRYLRKEHPVNNVFTETEESEMEYWRQPRKPPPYLKKKPRTGLASDGAGVVSQTSSSLTSSEDDFLSSSYSAENVALNLLRNSRVTDQQLPPASELQWLVSEMDAPQALLPLPKVRRSGTDTESDYNSGNASTSESSVGKIDNHIRLRGNLDWAPPRPQIIFTVHPPPTINILIKTQRCRCAGCGSRVDVKYASTFRYCYYLGRYFCTGCHTGKRARLPQMIIHQWDFSPYSVSNFSATLLEKLQSDPVYNILAINRTIYKKVKLNNFRNYRIQLGILKEYINNCKSADFLLEEMNKFPQYYSADVDVYSLEDLVHLRFSTGPPMKTKQFVADAIKHVLNCELCKGLGFICEICNRNEILFPFQINRVTRCSECASCFHLKCYNPGRISCPKCLRISNRRNNLDVQAAAVVPGASEGLDVVC